VNCVCGKGLYHQGQQGQHQSRVMGAKRGHTLPPQSKTINSEQNIADAEQDKGRITKGKERKKKKKEKRLTGCLH